MHLTSKPNSNLTFDKRHTPHIECLCLRNKRPQNANEAQRHMKFCGIAYEFRFFLTVLVTWHAFVQKNKQHFTFWYVFRRHKTGKCGVSSFYDNLVFCIYFITTLKRWRPNLNNMQTTIQTSLQNGEMIVSEKRVVTWKQEGKRGRGDGRKNQRFVFACFFSQLKMALRILIRFLVTLWWHLFKGAVSLKQSDAFRFKISISFKLCPLIFLS